MLDPDSGHLQSLKVERAHGLNRKVVFEDVYRDLGVFDELVEGCVFQWSDDFDAGRRLGYHRLNCARLGY
jgi:hypothetical protein